MRRLITVAAPVISIGAGLYLLSHNSVGGNSWFQILAHGIGAYFIAKGLFMGSALFTAREQEERLIQLVELAAAQHQRRTGQQFTAPRNRIATDPNG